MSSNGGAELNSICKRENQFEMALTFAIVQQIYTKWSIYAKDTNTK